MEFVKTDVVRLDQPAVVMSMQEYEYLKRRTEWDPMFWLVQNPPMTPPSITWTPDVHVALAIRSTYSFDKFDVIAGRMYDTFSEPEDVKFHQIVIVKPDSTEVVARFRRL